MSDINTSIPQDLWVKIFKNLPIKTLGQCRCVCKSWRALVVSPDFMDAHLKHYFRNEANSFLLYKQVSDSDETPEKHEQYTLFLDIAEEKASLNACRSFICPFGTGIENDRKGFRVVDSINGLICLSDDMNGYTNFVLLWNPLIHRYIVLPKPRHTLSVIGPYMESLGFGYDSKRGDHKVVRLVYYDDDWSYTTPPLVELYSVQDGTWRDVSADCLVDHVVDHSLDHSRSQCFLNGAIHWVALKIDSVTKGFHSNWLLLFDVEEEKFELMKLPEPLVKVFTSNLRVSGYGDRLSVLHQHNDRMTSGLEIWVKRDYDVGNSWSKMVGIELGWVHCLRKNGDLLGFKRGELVSYDPKTKQIQQLGLFCGNTRSCFTGAYTESLVLLDKKIGVRTYDESRRRRKISFRYSSIPGSYLVCEEKEGELD